MPPPSVHVVLRTSRLVVAAVAVAMTATLAVLVALPLAWWQLLAGIAALLCWAAEVVRTVALRRGARASRELWLAPNRLLAVRGGDGRLRAGHVRDATRVGAWCSTIVWRPDGAWWSRSILIVPDMLAEDDFRRLRVLLRYSRSGETQARPSSQSAAM